MHPNLYGLPNRLFYNNTVESGITAEQRTQDVSFHWPAPKYPMMLWNSDLKEMFNIETYYNVLEARRSKVLIDMLLVSGIAVITPYVDQRSYICNLVFNHAARYAPVEVKIIENFQGREQDYVIFTCVRSNADRQIGFFANEKQLNVAITRARYGLFILANVDVFKWHIGTRWLVFSESKGVLYSAHSTN
jgi:regulator of nonsense transcripts 1